MIYLSKTKFTYFCSKITNSANSVNTYSSRLLEQCVNELSRLPGIGRKTALRLALHLLKQENDTVDNLAAAISKMKSNINYCKICNNLSDGEICQICSNPKRDQSLVCVVSDIRDIQWNLPRIERDHFPNRRSRTERPEHRSISGKSNRR